MTRREIAELACKLMALYFFVQGAGGCVSYLSALLPAINDAITSGFEWGRFAMFMTAGGYFTALFAAAALLWWKTEHFSRRMVVDDPAPVTTREWNVETLTSIGFAVLGMSAVIDALQRLLGLVLSQERAGASLGELMGSQWGVSFAVNLGFAVFGIWLMLGSAGLLRLIVRLRTGRPGAPIEPLDAPPPDDRR